MTIHKCREEIDAIDDELLRLLNRRVRLAMTVGELKRAAGLPLYDPQRERAILERACNADLAPLDESSVSKFFRRIIHITRCLEARHVAERVAPAHPHGTTR